MKFTLNFGTFRKNGIQITKNWGQDKHKTHTLHAEDQIKTQNRKYYEIFSNRLKNKLKKTKIYFCPIRLHSTNILKNVNLIFHNMNGDIL